jgi:LuxR family maltose regulon positive regulatory protein
MLHIGQHQLLRRWFDTLPDAWQFQYPIIGLTQALWLGMNGNMAGCLAQVDAVEEAVRNSEREDRGWQLARVTAARCQIACARNDLETAEPLAEQALRGLPESDHHFRANVHQSLGEANRHIGRWHEARKHYHEALALVQDPGYRYRSTHIYGALADVELRQGKLRDAARFWDKALAVIEERKSWGYLPLPLTGWVSIRMAEIQYEWNELDLAAELVERGLERSEVGGVAQSLIVGYLIAGRLRLTQGDVSAAADYVELARPHLENVQLHHWIGRFERLQTEVWLTQDKLRTAVNWSDEMMGDGALPQRPQIELAYLAVARVLVYKGDGAALQQALTLLQRLEQTAAREGRAAVQIEALALQALAHQKRGDEPSAMVAIETALRLAEPEGYVRLFLDLGLSMIRLLQAARDRGVMANYVSRLLAAIDADWEEVSERPLPEPMTMRETEILRLIAAGLTNQEIAAQLVISPETVKKHASNIYGKLNVSSRTEAVATARELALLD